ncbi:capsular polysaccharide export protein, LipB/KpsS family [Paenibacillus alginolyticus]|uniref:Capsular biosynthesis protein n=1 Tax=Paenibacillus alginolyticus TaxID=59839 RepID=A0ABT4G8S6_9BACL|nr:hypothetical protein [Paenibacillus alginolyticus]MCY9692562.1 capsular biosynthesis protein [Paenibacillus alginolyticus]MEC0143768.1 hypothetical protein [Paenibacillus alginolyticus]
MDTLLVFTRPFTNSFMKLIKELYQDKYHLLYISDFKYRDDVSLIKRQYHNLENDESLKKNLGLDYTNVQRRCRYLRYLDEQTSRKLINSAWLSIRDIFVEHKVKFFIGLPMDNYYLDLINIYCNENQIHNIYPVQSFLPEKTRITTRGEHIKVSDPTEEEVQKYMGILLNKKFRPTWLSDRRNKTKLLKLYLRERGKKVLFETMKMLKRDKFSFHYNCIYPMPGAITVKSIKLLGVKEIFSTTKEQVSDLVGKYRAAVFLPLQFSPESSLDYNIADSRFSQYKELLSTVIANLPDDVLLIVKEHPDMYGYREIEFYDLFLNRHNIALVDVDIPVQEIFELCPFLLVTGGASTGAEAVIKGKTVISLGGAFYNENVSCIHEIKNFDDVPKWPTYLTVINNTEQDKYLFLKNILSNCVDGPYDFVRTPESKHEIARKNIVNIMEYFLNKPKAILE